MATHIRWGGRTFTLNSYGELNMRKPERMVPGFTEAVDFCTPPAGVQKGSE